METRNTKMQKRACVAMYLLLIRKGYTDDQACDIAHKSTGFSRDTVSRLVKEQHEITHPPI